MCGLFSAACARKREFSPRGARAGAFRACFASGSEKNWATMMNYRAVLFLSWLGCFAAVSSFAAKLGDHALPVNVAEWVKGEPPQMKVGSNVVVLVFCNLTRANDFALTNLSSLQKLYRDKGLIVATISDDSPEELKAFVQTKDAEIDFSVGADNMHSTAGSYMQAFNQFMPPLAFVIGKDRTVLWHGHPLRDGLGEVVDEIISDRYDLEKARKKIAAAEIWSLYLAAAHQGNTNSAKLGRALLAIRTNDAPALCDLAYQIASDPFIEKRDVALATAALDRAEELTTTNATDVAVDRAILLFQTGHEMEGLDKAKSALASARSEEEMNVVRTCIRAMEARLAAAKASQMQMPDPPKTNQTQAAASKP
jgi:hypothetical protein